MLTAQLRNDSIFKLKTLQTIGLKNTATNTSFRLPSFTDPRLMLFIFLSPECPLCKNYTPAINALKQQYTGRVEIWGIIPGKSYSESNVASFAKKYKIAFPLLIDQQKKLTNYLQASVTPEVVLLNANYELVYKGAIDDQVKSLSERSIKANRLYLTDAINAALGNQTVAYKRIKAVGCLINDY
ncbi:MAG: redoxin domain-containing protein [Chitinophagaceae bacterium]